MGILICVFLLKNDFGANTLDEFNSRLLSLLRVENNGDGGIMLEKSQELLMCVLRLEFFSCNFICVAVDIGTTFRRSFYYYYIFIFLIFWLGDAPRYGGMVDILVYVSSVHYHKSLS